MGLFREPFPVPDVVLTREWLPHASVDLVRSRPGRHIRRLIYRFHYLPFQL